MITSPSRSSYESSCSVSEHSTADTPTPDRPCERSQACDWIPSAARSTATAATSRSPASSSRSSKCSSPPKAASSAPRNCWSEHGMRTPTRSPTPCASQSRHCANASANPRSSPPRPAPGTASTLNQIPGVRNEILNRAAPSRLIPRRMLHLPSRTVRLRLTLLYSGLFLVSGAVLLAITYILVRRSSRPDLIIPGGSRHGPAGPRALKEALANPDVARYVRPVAEQQYARALQLHTEDLHQLLVRSGIALAIMTVVSLALGWLVAGRVLRPLRAMTATTRQISERNLHQRLALPGPRDELKDLADTIDGLLARLQAHVAEQQRFAANASHELRTPLAITQSLLDVARSDPNRDDGELVTRLHAVNTRAIDLTEALLLLSRADQRSFVSERVDLSLIAEDA